MGESVGRIIKSALEFCRQNTELLLISGAALVIIIITAAVIVSVKKKDKNDDLDFDEEKFLREKETQAAAAESCQGEEKRLSEDSCEHAEIRKGSLESDSKIQKQQASAEDFGEGRSTAEEGLSEKCCRKNPNKDINTEVCIKKADAGESIETLLRDAVGLSASNLEEVEIKIQGAEVRIKYSTKKNPDEVSREKNSDSDKDACYWDMPEQQEDIDNIVLKDIGEEISVRTDTCQTENGTSLKEGQKKEEIQLTPLRIKFGPDNVNTTRSGKVFTEKELIETIKD